MEKVTKHKKAITFWVSICMIAAVVFSSLTFSAAMVQAKKADKKNSLNKRKISLTLGDKTAGKAVLKVKNAAEKVIWKSSNKKVVSLKKITGKKKQKAVIQAKKAGKANITAKIGKKKLKCKVVVKEASAEKQSNVTGAVTPGAVGAYVTGAVASPSSVCVTVKFYNGSESKAQFSYNFSLDKWIDGQWKKVEPANALAVNTVGFGLNPQGEGELTFKIEETKEPLTTGKYRINTDLSAQEGISVNSSAEFWLTVE